MDERMQFVARRLAGEPMAELCRGFGISRKTGYKIFDRYQECGIQGLTDRSRRPLCLAKSLADCKINSMAVAPLPTLLYNSDHVLRALVIVRFARSPLP